MPASVSLMSAFKAIRAWLRKPKVAVTATGISTCRRKTETKCHWVQSMPFQKKDRKQNKTKLDRKQNKVVGMAWRAELAPLGVGLVGSFWTYNTAQRTRVKKRRGLCFFTLSPRVFCAVLYFKELFVIAWNEIAPNKWNVSPTHTN